MRDGPLLTSIEDGQPYFDTPIHLELTPKLISVAVQIAVNVVPIKKIITDSVIRYERTRLRWMRPDKIGCLMPR